MFGKVLTVFVAVLALQGISCDQHDTQMADVERGLIEDFQKLIEKLADAIENAISTAVEQLNKLFNEIRSLAESIVQGVTDKFKEVIDKFFQEISELKKKAEELHIDITECLGENEEALKGLPQGLYDRTLECINKQIDRAKELIEKTKTEINKTKDIVEQILNDFKECKGITAPICMAGVIANATGKIVSVPLGIAKLVADAARVMVTVKGDLVVCETKNLAEATKQAFNLSGEITKCIINKIKDE